MQHLGRLRGGGGGREGRPAAAGKQWTDRYTGEERDADHVLVLGGTRTVDELFAEPPRDDEQGDGWAVEERSRAGRYARRLWDDLLAAEELTDL